MVKVLHGLNQGADLMLTWPLTYRECCLSISLVVPLFQYGANPFGLAPKML